MIGWPRFRAMKKVTEDVGFDKYRYQEIGVGRWEFMRCAIEGKEIERTEHHTA